MAIEEANKETFSHSVKEKEVLSYLFFFSDKIVNFFLLLRCEKPHFWLNLIRNKPLTDEQKARDEEKSKTRARVEHVFGFMEQSMNGLIVNSIGIKRATGFIGLINLAYNLFKCEQVIMLNIL